MSNFAFMEQWSGSVQPVYKLAVAAENSVYSLPQLVPILSRIVLESIAKRLNPAPADTALSRRCDDVANMLNIDRRTKTRINSKIRGVISEGNMMIHWTSQINSEQALVNLKDLFYICQQFWIGSDSLRISNNAVRDFDLGLISQISNNRLRYGLETPTEHNDTLLISSASDVSIANHSSYSQDPVECKIINSEADNDDNDFFVGQIKPIFIERGILLLDHLISSMNRCSAANESVYSGLGYPEFVAACFGFPQFKDVFERYWTPADLHSFKKLYLEINKKKDGLFDNLNDELFNSPSDRFYLIKNTESHNVGIDDFVWARDLDRHENAFMHEDRAFNDRGEWLTWFPNRRLLTNTQISELVAKINHIVADGDSSLLEKIHKFRNS